MRPERLAAMPRHAIGFDLETDLIQPGLLAPPPVLGSAAELGPDGQIIGALLDNDQAFNLFCAILDDPTAILCGANIPFDELVEAAEGARRGVDLMPKIFAMYDPHHTIVRGYCDGRVFEIQLAEPLHAIAQGHLGKHALNHQPIINKETGRPGRYSLDTCTYEVQGREDAKANDIFRTSFAQFRGVPLDQLPFQARQYPVDDAVNTLGNALAQAGHLPAVHPHAWMPDGNGDLFCRHCGIRCTADAPLACMRREPRRNLHNLANQAYFAWAAHVGSAWGFYINQADVDALEKKYLARQKADAQPFLDADIIKLGPDEKYHENQSVLKRMVATAYGARDLCPTCGGTCKVPSPATNGKTKINCADCDGTGLALPPGVPRAEKGGVSKNRDTLLESGDDLLVSYGEQPSKKILTTYIPMLRKGRACNVCGRTGYASKYTSAHEDWCTAPNGEAGYRPVPFNPRCDPLKETGRAAIEDGFHGMPRKGGVRECIQARPGYLLSSEDYQAGELVTLAWHCIKMVGYSRLAEALNGGIDAHIALACTMLGISYEEGVKLKKAHDKALIDTRQVAKKANFSFGGGAGELTFVYMCRSEDAFTPCENGPAVIEIKGKEVRGYHGIRPCILIGGARQCGIVKLYEYKDEPCDPVCKACVECGKFVRDSWFKQWPEMSQKDGYFGEISKLIKETGPSGAVEVTQLVSLRTRGAVSFCDYANGLFQGQLADIAKAAFCAIQRECKERLVVRSSEMMRSRFDGCESPLYGSCAQALFHDETVAEHPIAMAPYAAVRISELMVEAGRWQCPELYKAWKAEPTIMRALFKGAEPRYARGGAEPADENDLLVCWEP